MDSGLKKGCVDRLSSLPYELVCQILSSLPTKDAFVASLSSKKITSTFSSLTKLDFDDSPISNCASKSKNAQFVERFQFFKMFVDNVLKPSQSPHLTKFRLALQYDYGEDCFADMESTHVDSWIGFPLSRGVKEIDLRIHLRNPGKLPSALFACETLDVLKLETNLDFELISNMPSFRFPNLKVLQLHCMVIPEDDFVVRLLSNCPLLEELSLRCSWKHGKSVTISSTSLQKLILDPCRFNEFDIGDIVTIDTPNLKCFEYMDFLAVRYCMSSMQALVEALIFGFCMSNSDEEWFRSVICLVRAMCNVQHLSLRGPFLEALGHDDLSNQMPVFHNLTHLELDHKRGFEGRWDTILFEFLVRSPILETLEFPNGIDVMYSYSTGLPVDRFDQERWVFRKNQVSPCCYKPHLKRIVIKEYRGTTSDLELVRFLLERAPALEELSVTVSKYEVIPGVTIDRVLVENAMKELQMVSPTCLIIVQ